MDVKEAFKVMMRDEVAPELRRLGFKGSGVNFTLPHPDLHLLIHFQQNEGFEAAGLDFTVNVSIISKQEYEEKRQSFFPKNPTAATIFPIGRQFRIGALMGGADKWWHITPNVPTHDVSREVLQAIEEFVVPELLRGSLVGPSLNRQQYDNS